MEGDDKRPSDPRAFSSGAAPSEDGVRPDPKGGSHGGAGSGEGSGLVEKPHTDSFSQEDEAKCKAEAENFINWVARRTGAKPAVMRAVWMAIIQEAPAYLVEENKTINLGFAQIHAFPYRRNWKQILHAKFPKLIPSLKMVPKPLAEAYLFNAGWNAETFNTDLCEFNKDANTIGWNLDISVNRQWYRVTGGYEKSKRASLGANGYGKRFLGLVKKNTRKILDFFARYVSQTTIPCAAIRKGGRSGGGYLVSYVPKGKVRPTAPQSVPAFVVSDNGEEQLKTPEDGAIQGEIKEVQPMPDLPFTVKDLWQQGNN